MQLVKAQEMRFLEGELERWLEKGLISTEQAAGIQGLYAVRRRSLSRVLMWAGGALLLLGLAGFAAVNWPILARLLGVLRRWIVDLLRWITQWGVSTALALVTVLTAGLSLLHGKEGEPAKAAPFALGVTGVFGLALTYPDCWGDFLIRLPAFLTPSVLAAATAVGLGLLMLWQLHRGFLTGGCFLAFLAARYFFDGLFDLMSRAWGFTVIGAVCLGAGLLLTRRRKQNVVKALKDEDTQQHLSGETCAGQHKS